jgi:GT2 family glycosyltransferase
MTNGLSLVGIGITTKERWEDLEITLTRLRDYGLATLETVVVDDGSTIPLPARLREQFPWVQFHRQEKSVGLIEERNRIARLLKSPLILQIDDDSFPVAGDLALAANWLVEQPDAVALALQVIFKHEKPPADYATRQPFPVRDFIGCAGLIKRELFLELGAFEGRLEFFTEEAEFCIRAIGQGYAIYGYPAFVVQHNVTPVARNHAWRTEKFIRNEMLLALWHFPFPENILRAAKSLPGMMVKNPELRPNWRALVRGYIQAPIKYREWPNTKKRLTMAQFRAWKKLPMGAEKLMGLK